MRPCASCRPVANRLRRLARELGISDSSIHQWRKELAEHDPEAFPGSGHQTALDEENRRLKRELARTRKARDMLKNRQHLLARPDVRDQVVDEYRKGYTVRVLCEPLGVSPSRLLCVEKATGERALPSR